jgi:hypothetical protein
MTLSSATQTTRALRALIASLATIKTETQCRTAGAIRTLDPTLTSTCRFVPTYTRRGREPGPPRPAVDRSQFMSLERPCRLCKSGPERPNHLFFECTAGSFPALHKLLLHSAALQYWCILSQIDTAVRSEDNVEVMGLNATVLSRHAVRLRGSARQLSGPAGSKMSGPVSCPGLLQVF